MAKYLIKNGKLIDPVNKAGDICDILVSDGKVCGIGRNIGSGDAVVIEAAGRIISPGFVDMHAHLREPGREDKETIRSGTRAAVHGGFTSVACMPNTEPAIDSPETAKLVKDIAARDAVCRVFVVGAITKGREGKAITDMKGMKREGAVGVSDDGSSVEDPQVMAQGLSAAKKEHLIVIAHCEDAKLVQKGVINKGFISTKMGLRGISRESEYERVRRDIELAARAGAPLHIAHVSCKESVDIIRQAKTKGIRVTAETCPHYFSLTEECCVTYDANTKMNPPLRAKEDVEAIKYGLRDGTLDVIATDHAPHTDSEKDVEFDCAPFGIIGLETALSLSVMELVDKKVLSWHELIMKLSANPARLIGMEGTGLAQGANADITIIDADAEYTYTKDSIASKARNSPFIGWKLKGRITHVLVAGKLVVKDGTVL